MISVIAVELTLANIQYIRNLLRNAREDYPQWRSEGQVQNELVEDAFIEALKQPKEEEEDVSM